MADEPIVIDDKPELGKDEILDELSKSDEELPTEVEKEIEEEITEKTEEEEEPEVEIKEEDELEDYKEIPKRQEILKAFPEIFKKFPGIEKAIYREQQYAEVFPTVSDAKNASARLEDYKAFEGELFDGNLEGVLKSVKASNDKAFGKITGQFLQTLAKVNEKAYYSTLNHVIKNSIITAYNSGKENDDEQLTIAAQLIHKFIYGSPTITAPDKPTETNKIDEKELALQNRERSFVQQQLTNAVSDVTSRTDNIIKSTVDKYIDTKSVMTSYVRSKAIDDVMTQVRDSIGNDTRFRALLDKMWEQSARENFSDASKLKIRNALISKAKTLLPGIIQKVKNDALKGHVTRSKGASESKDEKPLASGRPSNNSGKSLKDTKIPKGVRTIDYLMQD